MSSNKNSHIVVVGVGYVGLVTAVCFAHFGHHVVCLDIDNNKINKLNHGECPIFEPGLEELIKNNKERLTYTNDPSIAYKNCSSIFICVGTPENKDGTCNLSFIYDVADSICKNINNDCLIVIKSTVPVGTNEAIREYMNAHLAHTINLSFASNPEFLAQGSAVKDTLNALRIVIGAETESSIELLKKIYQPFNLPMIITNIKTAELMKYACNAFLATKISFINEMANLCDVLNTNIDDIILGMGLDPRIGNKFLNPGIGYGGSCFSKDTKALCDFASKAGYNLRIVDSTIRVNEEQRFILVNKLKKDYPFLKGLNIAILGITYKPNTNDLRDAPSLDIIKELLNNGTNIYAYDPVALPQLHEIFKNQIHYCNDIELAVNNCNIVMILTEWQQIVDMDRNLLRNKIVYDGRNCIK